MCFRWIWASIVIVLAAAAAILAQGTSTKPQAKTTDLVVGKADVVKADWGDKTKVLMTGNVKFTHGDTILTCDKVDYDKQTNVAVSPGKISISSPECDMTGDQGSANFKKKLGIVEGNVVMLAKPKKEDTPPDKESVKAKLSEPTTITCPRLEYLYKDKIATATGGVKFKQAKRSATAQKAVYDSKNEILTLTGDVKGIDEDGQTFEAPSVTISMKKGDEWMKADQFSGSFKINIGEEATGSGQQATEGKGGATANNH